VILRPFSPAPTQIVGMRFFIGETEFHPCRMPQ
jgi:hypothetical protein